MSEVIVSEEIPPSASFDLRILGRPFVAGARLVSGITQKQVRRWDRAELPIDQARITRLAVMYSEENFVTHRDAMNHRLATRVRQGTRNASAAEPKINNL